MNTIRYIRTQIFGVTQGEFAAICGVSQATISKWERDACSPPLSNLAAIRKEARRRRLGMPDAVFFDAPLRKAA